MWHGTCAANGRSIAREGIRVGTYLTDDEDFAVEYSTVCRHAPRCAAGAVVHVNALPSQFAEPGDGSMGWITTEALPPSAVRFIDWQ